MKVDQTRKLTVCVTLRYKWLILFIMARREIE